MKVKLNIVLSDIDGNQIIKFLQEKFDDSIEFVSQKIELDSKNNPYYKLIFSRSLDNWDLYNNYIAIDNDEIYVSLDEPWEGNDDDQAIEELLSKWLKTYTFEKINYELKFLHLMHDISHEVIDAKTAEDIDAIIEKLKLAKTYL
jgi:hypothetical protein